MLLFVMLHVYSFEIWIVLMDIPNLHYSALFPNLGTTLPTLAIDLSLLIELDNQTLP